MEDSSIRYYEFGEFRLDVRRRILFKNGSQIQLSGRIFDLLLILLQNEGKILEHDELLDKVWEGLIVEQSNLKKSVSALRHILGENPNEALYIKTIPRRGYSFVAPVKALAEEFAPVAMAEVLPTVSPGVYSDQSFHPGTGGVTETEVVIEEEIIEEEAEDVKPTLLPGKAPFLRRPVFLLGAGLLISLLVVGSLLVGWRIFATKSVSFSAENVRISKLTSDGRIFSDGISPDGKFFVYATNEKDDLSSLWVKQIATGSATRIVSPVRASFWSSVFSPDGNYIYYTLSHKENPQESGIYKIPSIGGTSERVATDGMILAFTLDGRHFLSTKNTDDLQAEVALTDNDGSNERILARFDAEYRIWSVMPSPDGKNILISLRRQYPNKVTYRLSEISLDANPDSPILKDILPEQDKAIRRAVWLPDRNSILLNVREDDAELVQIWQFFPGTGEWKRVTNDDNFYTNLGLRSDGKAFVTSQSIYLTTISQSQNNGAEISQIAGGTSHFIRAWWLDDHRILTSAIENHQETLSVISDGGQLLKRLTPGNDGVRLEPRLPASRAFVSFVSARSGTMQVWKVDLDGKNATQMTHTEDQVYEGRVLSDGQTVVYVAYGKPDGWRILKQTPDGQTIKLTNIESDLLAISPDEKAFGTFIKDQKTGKFILSVCSLENGAVLRSFGPEPVRGSIVLAFTPDGKGLAYTSTSDGVGNVIVQVLDGGPPKQITNFNDDLLYSFDWTPDGKTLLVVRGKQLSDAVMIEADSKNP